MGEPPDCLHCLLGNNVQHGPTAAQQRSRTTEEPPLGRSELSFSSHQAFADTGERTRTEKAVLAGWLAGWLSGSVAQWNITEKNEILEAHISRRKGESWNLLALGRHPVSYFGHAVTSRWKLPSEFSNEPCRPRIHLSPFYFRWGRHPAVSRPNSFGRGGGSLEDKEYSRTQRILCILTPSLSASSRACCVGEHWRVEMGWGGKMARSTVPPDSDFQGTKTKCEIVTSRSEETLLHYSVHLHLHLWALAVKNAVWLYG